MCLLYTSTLSYKDLKRIDDDQSTEQGGCLTEWH